MYTTLTLGRIVMTAGAQDTVHPEDVVNALARHAAHDWGDVCAEDKAINDQALVEGCRVLSVYADCHGTKFWIITEADRSVTTILLPTEY